MSDKYKATASQERVINSRGKNMLVSASAGTGKTTTMIQRIVSLIEQGADVSELVVVTFTNLAAAEMKARLADKLSDIRNDPRIAEQAEKLDTASICTLHSFCSELLRNYFYAVDIDPSFAILDSVTVAALRKNAMNDLFAEYFSKEDDVFLEVYKIFATHRREDNFRETLMRLYDFSRCLPDFNAWYAETRVNFTQYGDDNPLCREILRDIRQTLQYQISNLDGLAERARKEYLPYVDVFESAAANLREVPTDSLPRAVDGLFSLSKISLPVKKRNVVLTPFEESVRAHYKQLQKDLDDRVKKYRELFRDESIETLWEEMSMSVVHVDKLAELINRFDELFWQEKKERGGVDFNDLEHLTLKLLSDEETLADIRGRYKLVFVDEYQDTNPVQEAIVSQLAQDNLFMVGDVKQSIYGFRGCDPSIFVDKRDRYIEEGVGEVVKLNDNFRSNYEILNFVNDIFNGLMTDEFGAVDYMHTAQLRGNKPPVLKTASVRVDLLQRAKTEKREISEIYDITAESDETEGVKQGELIADRINEYVGMAYRDDKNVLRKIEYGDIVILMRSMTDRAVDIYNTLIAHNIPVAASFKADSYACKEVRDIINLLRVIDNPYNDIYLVGACLVFGGLSADDLVPVRLDTEGRISFYERLRNYRKTGDAAIAAKIDKFLTFLDNVRFFARSASVCDTVLKVIELTDYALSVQGLPNGTLRLNKLYSFVDGLRGASYAQSLDRFLSYVDETDEQNAETQSSANAVRIMTMHASKGLEFPVVIAAGLEAKFNFDRYAVKTNSRLGVAMNYYDFLSMQSAPTVGAFACELVNQNRQREEEMRLLYVAMTRAEFALDLVATVDEDRMSQLPGQPSRATCHFDWLHRALYYKYSGTKSVNGVEINVITDVVAANRAAQNNLCEQTEGVEEVRRKLSYVYPYLNEASMPSKVVSSALDDEYLDVTEEPQPKRVINADERNETGTAYHKVYQYVSLDADKDGIRECIDALVNDGKIERHVADKLNVQLIYDTLRNEQFRSLSEVGKVYHEVPFMLYAPYNELFIGESQPHYRDQVMLQGVIDLLVVGDGKAVVIDFKYTSRSDLVQQRYRAQLNSYRMAVERICGIKDIDCYVLSIADNTLIKM